MNSDKRCGGCGSILPHPFFQLAQTPVDCGFAPLSAEAAVETKRGHIRLSACKECGLIQNTSFDPGLIRFEPGYEVELTHSKTFEQFQKALANRLVEDFELREKSILEIGCGNGNFLRRICELGGNQGIGIDPTVSIPGVTELAQGRIELIRDYFPSRAVEDARPDLICSLSVIEDIPDFRTFLANIRALAQPSQTPVYFEVFNGVGALQRKEVWSIHYEQCNYFSEASLSNVLELNGFAVQKSGTCYEADQYVFAEAIPRSDVLPPKLSLSNQHASCIQQFSRTFSNQVDIWNKRALEALKNKDRVVVWGSGGKGISFLNHIAHPESVCGVVDINPKRQRRFIPGTGHPIVSPDALELIQPTQIWLTNRIYFDEIIADVSRRGHYPKFHII